MAHDQDELAERIAEADRMASRPRPYRQGDRLHATIHEGDDMAAAMETALAEHISATPEDAGRTVADFRWVIHEIVSSLRNPIHNSRRALENAAKMKIFFGHNGLAD